MPAALKRDWLNRCMGLACGAWGWPVEQFWRATPLDIVFIVEGMNGVRGKNDFSADDAKDLRALLDKTRNDG